MADGSRAIDARAADSGSSVANAPTVNVTVDNGGGAAGAVILSEVFYDASGSDNGLEWVELYNDSDVAVNLSGWSLGNGGSDYTASKVQLSGTIGPRQTFVVGGPTSNASNANPVFDLVVNFSPDFQNSGCAADGVALFDVPAAQVTASTIPADAVVYGPVNSNNLINRIGQRPRSGGRPRGFVDRTRNDRRSVANPVRPDPQHVAAAAAALAWPSWLLTRDVWARFPSTGISEAPTLTCLKRLRAAGGLCAQPAGRSRPPEPG